MYLYLYKIIGNYLYKIIGNVENSNLNFITEYKLNIQFT